MQEGGRGAGWRAWCLGEAAAVATRLWCSVERLQVQEGLPSKLDFGGDARLPQTRGLGPPLAPSPRRWPSLRWPHVRSLPSKGRRPAHLVLPPGEDRTARGPSPSASPSLATRVPLSRGPAASAEFVRARPPPRTQGTG